MPPPVKAKREGAQAEIDSEEGAGMTPLPFLLGAALEAAHPRAANFVQFSLDLGDASELNIEALTTVVERAAQGLELVAAHLAIGTEESSRDLYSISGFSGCAKDIITSTCISPRLTRPSMAYALLTWHYRRRLARSRCMDKIEVMSFTTRTPRSPMRRSNPPVASLPLSRMGVPDNSAPSELIVDVMIAPAPASAWTGSVFALPGPEITRSQAGSPVNRSAAAVASTAWMASRS